MDTGNALKYITGLSKLLLEAKLPILLSKPEVGSSHLTAPVATEVEG